MTVTEAVKKILRAQLDGYRALVGLLKRERQCLVAFDEKGMGDLSREKDTLALKLRLLEEERVRLMKKCTAQLAGNGNTILAGQSGQAGQDGTQEQSGPKADLTLAELYTVTGDEDFRELRVQFSSLVKEIEELNKFNKLLIERSLQYLKSLGNVFRRKAGSGEAANVGVYLRKEA